MRKNNQNKKQNLIIAVLAVLLIGLLTVNITYAFFTDKKTGTQTLNFGKIELNVTDLNPQEGEGIVKVTNTSEDALKKLMPGSKIEGNFDIAMAEGSQSAWLRFKLVASAKETSIAALLGHTFSDVTGTAQYVKYNGVDYRVENGVVKTGTNFETTVSDSTITDKVTTYLENLPSGVTYSVDSTEAGTVAATFDTETYVGFDQTQAEALSKKYVSIMNQIDLLNEQFDLSNVTDQDGASTTVAWYRGSDGYFYRNGATDSTTALDLAFTYYVPFSFTNDLQELKIEYALDIEAVQYANTTGTNATFQLDQNDVVTFEIDVNPDPQLGDPVEMSTANIASAEADHTDYVNVLYSARAFHAAVAEHNGIQAK